MAGIIHAIYGSRSNFVLIPQRKCAFTLSASLVRWFTNEQKAANHDLRQVNQRFDGHFVQTVPHILEKSAKGPLTG